MRLGRKKIEGLNELMAKHNKCKKAMYSCGSQLNTITKELAEILGRTKIHINVPYSNFNCHGEAKKVARDVEGLMPFSSSSISYNKVTTLYYGDNIINSRNYLPFLADVDCFFISNIDTSGSLWITVDLIKAPSWRSYL